MIHPVEQMKSMLDHRAEVIEKALVEGDQWRFRITREDGLLIEMSISPQKLNLPYQQRVVEEKRDLDEKLEKLREFILYNPTFKSMRAKERQLLVRQQSAMTAYSHVLRDRLETFEVEGE